MRGAVLLAALALFGCAAEPTLDGPLPLEDRYARMQACNQLFREAGGFRVFAAPGTGSTQSAAWQALTSAEQSELIRLSACLQTGGAVEPVTFEVYDGYQRRTLARREVPNNVDFARLVAARD